MKTKEKPITKDLSRGRERYQKALHDAMENVRNPYESDRHKQAQDYLKRRKIKIKPLSPPRENNE